MRRSLKSLLSIALSAAMIGSIISYAPIGVNAAATEPVINETAEFSSYILLNSATEYAAEYAALNTAVGAAQGEFDGITYTNYALVSAGAKATAGKEGTMVNQPGIIDGDKGNGVQITTAIPSYFSVDLGGVKSISVVETKWESAATATYTVDFSNNGEDWTTVAYVKSYPKGLEGDRIDKFALTSATNARYVRVTVLSLVSNYGPNLREISVFGDGTSNGAEPTRVVVPFTIDEKMDISTYNLVKGINVETNMYQSGYTEGNFTNITNGTWAGDNWACQTLEIGDSGWLAIDLGQEYTMDEIESMHIKWNINGNTSPDDGFGIYVANTLDSNLVPGSGNTIANPTDNTAWTKVYGADSWTEDLTSQNDAKYGMEIKFSELSYENTFRYIKIQCDMETKRLNWGFQIYEIAVLKSDAVPAVETSSTLAPIGFQLSMDIQGIAKNAPAFRMISKCPKIVKKQNVTSYGTIFVPVNKVTGTPDKFMVCDNVNLPLGAVVTATANGVISDWNKTDLDNTYYVATVKTSVAPSNMAGYCSREYYVRTFCVLADGTYVYSKDIRTMSIYAIANDLYENKKMNSLDLHNYLYNNIISVVDPTAATVDFAWSNSLYTK